MIDVDQIIAAELRSWAVRGLWRKLSLPDLEKYLDLCKSFGVPTELPERACSHCGGTLKGRPDRLFCSKRCRQVSKRERRRERSAAAP